MRTVHALCVLAIVLLLPSADLLAQHTTGRSLTHDDYDSWKSIGGRAISRDGKWVATSIKPQVGDARLEVRSTRGKAVYEHPVGSSPQFTEDGRFLVFHISPLRAETRAYEMRKLKKRKESGGGGVRSRSGRGGRPGEGEKQEGETEEEQKKEEQKTDKEKEDEKPLASMGIMDLSDGSVKVIKRVESFKVPVEGPSFVLYKLEKKPPERKGRGTGKRSPRGQRGKRGKRSEKPAEKPEQPVKKKQEKPEKKQEKPEKKKERKYLADGTTLVIRELATGKEERIKGVVTYGVTRKKGYAWYARSSKKDEEKIPRGLYGRHLASGKKFELVKGGASYKSFTTDREVTRFAFVADRRDRDAEKPTYDLYAWDFKANAARVIVSHTTTKGFPKDRCVAAGGSRGGSSMSGRTRGRGRRGSGSGGGGSLRFSRDGKVLMFGAAALPEKDLPDILPEDKVTLDIWHWKDPHLQTAQAKRAGRNRSRSLSCAWHFKDAHMTVIAHVPEESVSFIKPDGSRALVRHSQPYAQEVSWDGTYTDVYVANTLNGSREKILTRARGSTQTSPDGRYLLHFKDGHWQSIDLIKGGSHVLTRDLGVSFEQEDWDTPSPARDYGIGGWTKGERDVLIYDRYDIWRIAPDGAGATCLTDGFGRENTTRFRYVRLDPEERFLPRKGSILLSAFNEETMASGYYTEKMDGVEQPHQLVMLDKSFGRLTKPKDAKRLFFTLTTFRDCPDLWTADMRFSKLTRLTDINPQQKDYRWGQAELVRWHSADGTPLKGVLVKPDGFDAKKKYPLMVYFYEKLSHQLHSYHAPAPGTSPNAAYYVSNGYLWFTPDIVYREGHPGESCINCLVAGVQSLVAKGFVDESAIGAAGHSWGGYQTAYLVTRTNMFKAVESGAPVSNMTSAYGGVRWSTGLSRAFQYERTQSRIGGSLWEYPKRFVENSPIFAADKVETPVLMLHNDKDGAVPWYQGIEYFCALRRLGKEVYMFNYIGAGHGLSRRANQMDWAKRMQQYFDHHLRGAEAPRWMKEGVAYVDREKEKLEFRPPKTPVVPEKPATPEAATPTEEAGSENQSKR